ncbi:STAS domain-containing protein [Kitasatospora misakiensis]|uniref:Anti-sigma factor antagonist n=1 Tax=Kitasatospora misakiensis TaxID=67330 RepID=A0ABW0X3F3_9ACTN
MTMPADSGPDTTASTALSGPGLDVVVADFEGGVYVCSLTGDLDGDTLPPAARALGDLLDRRPAALVVDLAGVGFCDSSGLNLLLRTRLAAGKAGTALHLAAAPPGVMRVLELTGAQSVFSLHPSVEAALPNRNRVPE